MWVKIKECIADWSDKWEWYRRTVLVVKYIWFCKRTYPNDWQQNKVTYCTGVPEVPMHKWSNWIMVSV